MYLCRSRNGARTGEVDGEDGGRERYSSWIEAHIRLNVGAGECGESGSGGQLNGDIVSVANDVDCGYSESNSVY